MAATPRRSSPTARWATSEAVELGGGTGEDAAFLAANRFQVLLTDPSPAMVSLAHNKLAPLGSSAEILAAEDMENFAHRKLAAGEKAA